MIEWADKILFPVTKPVRVTISVIENNAREIVIDQGEEGEADSADRE